MELLSLYNIPQATKNLRDFIIMILFVVVVVIGVGFYFSFFSSKIFILKNTQNAQKVRIRRDCVL